ncbi:hypothetical protein NA56DRAFT_708205 [Hyaloscypha hepaticicola]|uniref:Uncharacterized protein n=1 Tax=Hyaloscypha hepaticicola TaxID=2082293 RepID=A0A2J6PSI1_9HELO|nr:hypothetical protein NA56DRAFT_708205 [Hyaloscypha hepaticicola]
MAGQQERCCWWERVAEIDLELSDREIMQEFALVLRPSAEERILDGVTAWPRAYSSSGHVKAETDPEQLSQAAREASEKGIVRRGPWALQH